MRRFPVKQDMNRIDQHLAAHQGRVGTTVLWYMFDRETTALDFTDDLFDEESSESDLDFYRPFRLPVISAMRTEGAEQISETGTYTTDRAHLVVSDAQAKQQGLIHLEERSVEYLNDRFVYDNVVFKVNNIQVLGQVQNRDVIIAIDGNEIDPAELRNSEDFAQWADRR